MRIREDRVNPCKKSYIGRGLWLRWIIYSITGVTIGWLTAWFMASLIFRDNDSSEGIARILFVATIGDITGALFGIMQWLILRKLIPQINWWIPASAVGVMMGLVVGNSVYLSLRETWTLGMALKRGVYAILPPEIDFIDFFLSGIMGAAIAGVITGGVLVWLLKYQSQESMTIESTA